MAEQTVTLRITANTSGLVTGVDLAKKQARPAPHCGSYLRTSGAIASTITPIMKVALVMMMAGPAPSASQDSSAIQKHSVKTIFMPQG